MSDLTLSQRQRIEESKRKALALRAAKQQQAKQQKTASNPTTSSSGWKPSNTSRYNNNITPNRPVSKLTAPLPQASATVPTSLTKVTLQQPTVASTSSSSGSKVVSSVTSNTPGFGNGVSFYKNKNITSGQASNNTSAGSGGASGTFSWSGKAPQAQPQNAARRVSPWDNEPKSKDKDVLPVTEHQTVKAGTLKGQCVLRSRTRFEVKVGYSSSIVEVFKTMATKQYDPQRRNWSFDLRDYKLLMDKVRAQCPSVQLEPLPHCVLHTFKNGLQTSVSGQEIPQADLSQVDRELTETLLPFQQDGVNFAVWHKGRVLIADDMGLGKTLQALCIACVYRKEWPLLIVVPSSVRFAWQQQLLRWVPSVNPQDIKVVTSGKETLTSNQVVIISYDLMVRYKVLQKSGFGVVIMDESHFLKNSKTARTKAAVPILKSARRVVLLSGTPALSRPAELFTQISAVDHRSFPKFHEFGLRYCDGKQNPWGWDFNGSSNMEELQIVLEEHIMIRRLKKDVLSQLPSKRREMVILDPSAIKATKTMKTSHKMVDNMRGKDQRGALLEYFHETGECKATAVKEYVLDLLEADHKFLVFGHHQELLNVIEEAVKKKFRYMRIDGRTSAEQRNHLVELFQKNDDVKVAILSITAANAGLNLTSASLVIFAELFWNPGILVQAEDRAHRIGQEDSVNIRYLVARGTADDYIWPIVQQKLNVLSKAGLGKDDFCNADTKDLQQPKHHDIMSYFEKAFFEDDFEDSFADIEDGHSKEAFQKLAPMKPINDDSPKKPTSGGGTLLKYLSPTKANKPEAPAASRSDPSPQETIDLLSDDEWDLDLGNIPEETLSIVDQEGPPPPKRSKVDGENDGFIT